MTTVLIYLIIFVQIFALMGKAPVVVLALSYHTSLIFCSLQQGPSMGILVADSNFLVESGVLGGMKVYFQ